MNNKIRALTALIACAMLPSVVFAQTANPSVETGVGKAVSETPGMLFHGTTTVTNERVGVAKASSKSFYFAVHSATADDPSRFVVNLPVVSENSYALVTAEAIDGAGRALPAPDCSGSANVARSCVFPSGTRKAVVTFSPALNMGTSAYSYRTYSTSYIQDCDLSAARYCGLARTYGEYKSQFTSATENKVGTIFQGDVDIFHGRNASLPENAPRAGDVIRLRVNSSVAVVSNTPTLRVKADFGDGDIQVGHRYPCKPAPGVTSGKVWDCEIPEGDAVPNLAGFSNPRVVFSSSRGAGSAIITVTNATKLSR